MLKLLVCRHGESEADQEPRRIEGAADFPLTDVGHRQAERLAEAVAARYRVDQVIASPLRRAQATAAKIASATGAPLKTEPRLADTALCELWLRDGRVQVARWNDATHLRGLA